MKTHLRCCGDKRNTHVQERVRDVERDGGREVRGRQGSGRLGIGGDNPRVLASLTTVHTVEAATKD